MSERWNAEKEKRRLTVVWTFAIIFLVASIVFFKAYAPVTVNFIDVGQGDACFVQAGINGEVLIDGGDDGEGRNILEYLRLKNVLSLDAIFISHFHADHAEGIYELLDSGFPVEKVYIPAPESDKELEDEIIKLIRKRKIPMVRLVAGDKISVGKMEYEILWPIDEDMDIGELNDTSLVMKATYGETEILFTGDIEKHASGDLAEMYDEELEADILKVSHHGGKSSLNLDMIKECEPKWAVISVGKDNPYRMPSVETIECLEENDIDIWRTDEHGTIEFTLNKEGIANVSTTDKRR